MRKVLENKEVCLNGRSYLNLSSDTIPQRIYQLRKQERLSRNVFADMVGVTVKSIVNWECGLTIPAETSLNRICNAFGLDGAYFEIVD